MTSTTRATRATRAVAAAVLAGAGALASSVLTPAFARADPQATGPYTWCPGHTQPFAPSGQYRPNWDWDACHTYWSVLGMRGNVSANIWEGALPPAEVPLQLLFRPSVNCGLFYCQDPGGHYTVDPRNPAP